MCGIVGSIAERNVWPILLEGLQRLEYRGYDSAGMAIVDGQEQIHRLRATGKVAELGNLLQQKPLLGHLGIAHTRWATHGEPNEKNAHPHFSHQEVAIVHNGIIENHDRLREQLTAAGYHFASDTDTEVVAHLLHQQLKNGDEPFSALQKTVAQLEGAYGIGMICQQTPNKLFAVRSGSPLVIGLGIGENFIASDPLALLPVAQKFIYLEEGDMAVIEKNHVAIFDCLGKAVERSVHTMDISQDSTSKGEYRHYMLKEIYEQAQVASDAIEGRIVNGKLVEQAFGVKAHDLFSQTKHIHLVACGTSYHAALTAKYWLEQHAGVTCQVEVASENRYRDYVVPENSLFVALSQSGETADTLAALRKAKESGYLGTLAICNVAASSLVREADLAYMTRAGTEIGVAATKSFTSQLIAMLLLTVAMTQHTSPKSTFIADALKALHHLPEAIHNTLKLDKPTKKIAKLFAEKYHALFLGRGIQFPIALEGALKLKEISYVHAEAYPAGELKHGPLALVDKHMPIVVNAPNDYLISKLQSNIKEVEARGGELIIFSSNKIKWPESEHMHVIHVDEDNDILSPIIYNIPLQLLSYYVAVIKGTDVDQPRNLAKSVTVE